MKKNYSIKGIDCANCARELEEEINKIEGVQATINFMTEKLIVEIEDDQYDELFEKIIKVIKDDEPECTVEEV